MTFPPQTGTVTPTQTVCSPQRFSESSGASEARSPGHPPLSAALDQGPAKHHLSYRSPTPDQPLTHIEPLDWMKLLYQSSAIRESWLEFRLIQKQNPRVQQKWMPFSSLSSHLGAIKLDDVQGWQKRGFNVYYGISLRIALGRSGDAGVHPTPLLWLDLDLKIAPTYLPEGSKVEEMTPEALHSAKAQLYDEVMRRCKALNLLPVAVVNTGHGLQVLWRREDCTTTSETEALNHTLYEHFKDLGADRSTKNAERILRLPGSLNLKNPQRPLPVEIWHLNPDQDITRSALMALTPEPVQASAPPVLAAPGMTVKSMPTGDTAGAQRAAKRRRAEVTAAVRSEAEKVATAPSGERNTCLNVAAMKLSRFLPHGELSEDELTQILVKAAQKAGLDDDEILRTIRSGIKAGKLNPADPKRFDQEEREKAERPGMNVESGAAHDEGEDRALPVIQTNGSQLRQQTAATVTALLAANRDAPRLFVRAGELVRILDGRESAELQPLQVVDVISEMTDAADFVSVRVTQNGEKIETHVRPPIQIAQDVLSRTSKIPWPRLEHLASAPIFDKESRLVTDNGYHANSGIYLHGAMKLPGLPTVPEALVRLDEVFVDFVFCDRRAARAHLLAAMLSVPCRQLFNGPTPLFLFNAPQQATGKSLAAEMVSLIATGGTRISVSSFPARAEEQEKNITARLYGNEPVILLDNVTHLGGEVLASALTSATWSGRYLGRSQMLTLPNNALWLATGNNPQLDNEMPRRIVPVRLTADRARPEDRTDFQHPDLKRWVQQNLPRIYAALLTLVVNWREQGSPRYTKRRLGGYEDWAEVIGGILFSAGVDGFLTDREDIYQTAADGGLTEWAQLLEHLHALKGPGYQWRVKEMVPHIEALGLLEDLTENAKTDHSKARRLASALRGQRGRVIGAYQLMMDTDRANKTTVWRVVPAGDATEF